ncbi:hypothetical protein CsSME_00024237 [Camellia sinensis var. sinensis]
MNLMIWILFLNWNDDDGGDGGGDGGGGVGYELSLIFRNVGKMSGHGHGSGMRGKPRRQKAMGDLAHEMDGALRESMDILRAEHQVQAQVAEAGPSFLKREFFLSNSDEFLGDSKKPLKDKFLSPNVREKLREQFLKLKQLNTPVAEFEVSFTSLSRFAPELVMTEECRCLEFEKRLRTRLLFKVATFMISDYGSLMEATTHLETVIYTEEEPMRGSRQMSQEVQGET